MNDLSEDDVSAAQAVAGGFLQAYGRTDQEPTTWWSTIQPLLTPAAAEDYSYVDPAEVPALEVQSAKIHQLPGSSPSLVQVQVPTNVGDYTITLTRDSGDDAWLVARADPPGTDQ